uniref:Uncharacterized protein n=1 Tax=Pseudonaja textilis TaxID=8673 RepID=A0A670ZAG5_PSETE
TMKVIFFTLFCLLIARQKAKVFDVCDLYYILKFFQMDPFKGIYSEQFVCAADYSSRLDTLYYENIRGVPRYGIFQLSGLEWCDNGRHPTQNRCNISCDCDYIPLWLFPNCLCDTIMPQQQWWDSK